ncbi:unnamed protein product [Allacma fusca]|uniref:C2H2-type domain-containing protein n=1 Tax=Allacma fusca TaxID=39272 RepID=A0A8J2LDY9_9HEXA|nr:unnamed protein product [Allacma fusca]
MITQLASPSENSDYLRKIPDIKTSIRIEDALSDKTDNEKVQSIHEFFLQKYTQLNNSLSDYDMYLQELPKLSIVLTECLRILNKIFLPSLIIRTALVKGMDPLSTSEPEVTIKTEPDIAEFDLLDERCDNETSEGNSDLDLNGGNQGEVIQCLKCQFCSETLFGILKLKKHLKNVHSAKVNMTCSTCGEQFKRNKEFKKHLRSNQSCAARSSEKKRSVKVAKKVSGKKKSLQKKGGKVLEDMRSGPEKSEKNKRVGELIKPSVKAGSESKALSLDPTVGLAESEISIDGYTDVTIKSEPSEDDMGSCDNDFLEFANMCTENEAEKSSGKLNKNGSRGTSVPNPVPRDCLKSKVRVLEDVRPPQRRSRKQNLTSLSKELQYQIGIPRATKPLEVYLDMHSSNINSGLAIYQCLQCAKTFSTRASLQAHHKLHVSHAAPVVDPLEINTESEKGKITLLKQPTKLNQGTGVEKDKVTLMTSKITDVAKTSLTDKNKSTAKTQMDSIDIQGKIMPTANQVTNNPLIAPTLLTTVRTSGLPNILTANVSNSKLSPTHKLKVAEAVPTEVKCTIENNNFEKICKNYASVLPKSGTPTGSLLHTPTMNRMSNSLSAQGMASNSSKSPSINIKPMGLATYTGKLTISGVAFSVMPCNFEKLQETTKPESKDDKETFETKPVVSSQKSVRKSALTVSHRTYSQTDNEPEFSISGENLYCERCDKIFTLPQKFTEHMRYHVTKNRYVCSDCGRKFTYEKEYKGHLDAHNGLNPFKCTTCLKYFSSGLSLQRHNRTVHGPKATDKNVKGGHLPEKRWTCTLCNLDFTTRRRFVYHVQRHGKPDMRFQSNNPNRSVSCDVCSSRMTEAAFPKHMLKHEVGFPKPFQCTFCDKNFSQNSSRNKHLLSHPEFSGNICQHCYKELPSQELLEEHESRHPPSPRRRKICQVCGKGLATTYGLKQHMLLHGTETPFQCHVCGKFFKTRNYLRIHNFSHSKRKPFSCKFCDYHYKFGSLGHYHTLHSHFGPNGFSENDKLNREKNFFCEVCGIGFIKEESLRQHRVYHSETKTIRCQKPECAELFFTVYDRSYHLMTAHCVKRKCEYCGKEFKLKAELDQHRRYKHTGESPFSCTLCDRKYKSKPDLNYHIATHTGEYKFQCEYCEKKFISKANMHAHVRIHTNHQCRKCGVTCGSAKAWKEHPCEWKTNTGDIEFLEPLKIEND